MKAVYIFETKPYRCDWNVQNIHTEYDECIIDIIIENKECIISIDGKSRDCIDECFYIIWELLALYDGYFYKPISYKIDDIEQDVNSLYRIKMYKTSQIWIDAAILLGRNNRDFSKETIKKYSVLRNECRKNKKLTKTVVNSFFYLHSESYEEILIDHRLSLFLNLCDGVIINFDDKKNNNIMANISGVLRYIDVKKVKHGASLLDVSSSKLYEMLADERNELDHYSFKENSVSSFVSEKQDRNSLFLYFIYVIELALRIFILARIGYVVNEDVKEYSINEILDWVINAHDLDEKCYNPANQARQEIVKFLNMINESKDEEV